MTLEVGRNHIVDKVVDKVTYENGRKADVTWYQFRIPMFDYEGTVGDISDFKTIRFMRMFMTGFEDTTFLRFRKARPGPGRMETVSAAFHTGR